MAHDCDLAVLTVDDPAFFKGVPALELSTDLPRLQEELVVVGYPLGGDQISITQGVTSRIDYGTYSFSTRDHVVVQVRRADGLVGARSARARTVIRHRLTQHSPRTFPSRPSLPHRPPADRLGDQQRQLGRPLLQRAGEGGGRRLPVAV